MPVTRQWSRSGFALAIALALAVTAWSAGGVAAPPPHPVPEVVDGFTVTPLSPLVGVPTAMTFGPDDDLFVATLLGDVLRVPLTWTPAGPVAGPAETYASGFSQPLGVAFHGDALLVADSGGNPATGRTDGRVTLVEEDGNRTVILDGLPNGRHNTNHVKFGPDGLLYVTNGNPNDSGPHTGPADVFPYSGAILAVDVDALAADPAVLKWTDNAGALIHVDDIATHPVNADFAAKVDVVAFGFRNPYSLAFHPDDGAVYTGVNGADVPPSQDPLYRIGVDAFGTDYGFPFCYAEGPAAAVGSDITVNPNPVFPNADCDDVPPPTALLGWHVCATGIDFPTGDGAFAFPAAYRQSVFVAECGPLFPDSMLEKTLEEPTTRNTGHKVTRVALDADGEAVEVKDFLTGLALPTDLRFGPDGAMYVADAGTILRVAPAVPAVDLEVTVAAAGASFAPPVLTVPAGTTVTWEGVLLPHTVTTADSLPDALNGDANDPFNNDGNPDSFNANLPQGGSFSHTFENPGEYAYFCAPHVQLGMVGTIIVT